MASLLLFHGAHDPLGLPERAQGRDLACLVDPVGEYAFGVDHLAADMGANQAGEGDLAAAGEGVVEHELDRFGGCDCLVPERRNGIATAVALALRVEYRGPDGVLDDTVGG